MPNLRHIEGDRDTVEVCVCVRVRSYDRWQLFHTSSLLIYTQSSYFSPHWLYNLDGKFPGNDLFAFGEKSFRQLECVTSCVRGTPLSTHCLFCLCLCVCYSKSNELLSLFSSFFHFHCCFLIFSFCFFCFWFCFVLFIWSYRNHRCNYHQHSKMEAAVKNQQLVSRREFRRRSSSSSSNHSLPWRLVWRDFLADAAVAIVLIVSNNRPKVYFMPKDCSAGATRKVNIISFFLFTFFYFSININ